MTLDDTLIFLVFIIFLIYSGILIIITIRVLKRNIKNSLNQIFAFYCISMSTSSVLVFHVLFRDPNLSDLASIIALSMYYFGAILSAGLLFLYTLTLYKPETMFKIKNQVIFILIYIGATIPMVFIPNGVSVEVTTDNIPVTTMNTAFFMYFFITILIMFIGTLFLAVEVTGSFQNKELKRRFKSFYAGIALFYSYPLLTSILVFFSISLFFYTIVILIMVFLGIYFIYYGIAKTMED